MPRPCKECPFRREYEKKNPEVGTFMFIAAVLTSEPGGMQCHMTEADRRCVGHQEFIDGGNERCFGSVAELAEARTDGETVPEFFRQLERLAKT